MTHNTSNGVIYDLRDNGFDNATFYNTYYRSNRVYYEEDQALSLSLEDVEAALNALVNMKGPYEGDYDIVNHLYPSSVQGGIHVFEITPRPDNKSTRLSIKVLASPEMVQAIRSLFRDNPVHSVKKHGVWDIDIYHYYISARGGLDHIHHCKDTEDFLSIREELYPGILVSEMMSLYSDSNENNLILTGAPGTGKTCFAKKCLREHAIHKESDIRVAYVKDPELLKKDSFWAQMSSADFDVLVLDDLDDELLPRSQGTNAIVNNLLSFSDGLFDLETKIIITTNQPNSMIDKALIRPGRCFDILSLPQLTRAAAKDIWVKTLNADIDIFEESFGTAVTISQAALMSEHARWCKLGAPKYLLDPSISIRKLVEEGTAANSDADTPVHSVEEGTAANSDADTPVHSVEEAVDEETQELEAMLADEANISDTIDVQSLSMGSHDSRPTLSSLVSNNVSVKRRK